MRNIGKHQIFLNLLGNIFASKGSKFCFRNNVSMGGQTAWETLEETSRITNVSATMFPSLPRALSSRVKNNILLTRCAHS